MIEFTLRQEDRVTRRDCRAWTELMVDAWYTSEHSYKNEFSAETLVSHLKEIYFFCRRRKVVNAEHIVLLAFILLRANSLRCTKVDFDCIVEYFVHHAELNNVDYAKKWIDFYFAEMIIHGI